MGRIYAILFECSSQHAFFGAERDSCCIDIGTFKNGSDHLGAIATFYRGE